MMRTDHNDQPSNTINMTLKTDLTTLQLFDGGGDLVWAGRSGQIERCELTDHLRSVCDGLRLKITQAMT